MSSPSDLEKAIQNLRAKQQEYYVQWVRDAIDTEKQRKAKLEKVTSREECQRLEKQFERERAKDKERMQQIQEDHQLILKAKVKEWKTHGVPESALGLPSQASTESIVSTTNSSKEKPLTTKMTKATLDRLSAPTMLGPAGYDMTQALQFQKDVIRKQNNLRLNRGQPPPSLSQDNLKTLSETDLLHKKMNLLNQLHGVVTLQERIIQDDQCTVRSAVSSWKSADFHSVKEPNR